MKTIAAFAVGMAVAPMLATAQTAPAAHTAGQTMKNVQVMKDVAVEDWNPMMNLIGGSLGVRCEHCHAATLDSDAKPAKVTARNMMKMTREINDRNFGGAVVVTCNTCHQGNLRPQATARLFVPPPHTEPSVTRPAVALPEVEMVLANYRKAVGGDGLKSVHLMGKVSGYSAPPREVELHLILPAQMAMSVAVNGASGGTIVINGDRGWVATPAGKQDLEVSIVKRSQDMMNLFTPVKTVAGEAAGKVVATEKVGDRDCFVVESTGDKVAHRQYFDTQSGLRRKMHEERQTPFGLNPTDIVFDDYRDVNGAKMPFRMTVSSVGDRTEYEFSQVETNVAVDPAKFAEPVKK
jgi:hypothetical protein